MTDAGIDRTTDPAATDLPIAVTLGLLLVALLLSGGAMFAILGALQSGG